MWTDLARCLNYAQAQDFAGKPVSLYLSNQAKSSVNQEFLRAMMLSAASTGSLSLLEQEISDRWVEHFTELFQLDSKPDKSLNMYMDLDAAAPPRRVVGRASQAAQRLFFGASGALPRIHEYLESTQETGAMPVPFRLPKGGATEHVVKVLEHFVRRWGNEPPARKWDRRESTNTFEVRHEFGVVWKTLEDAESGALDFTEALAKPEYWVFDNAGRGGYSAIVPKGMRRWLWLGVLVATRVEYRHTWSIAVLRRVESDDYQQRKVGLQFLTHRPASTLVRSRLRPNTQARPEQGILINTKPGPNGGIHLLLRPSTFSAKEDIEVSFGADHEKTLSLTPAKVMETAIDFEWVRYTVKA